MMTKKVTMMMVTINEWLTQMAAIELLVGDEDVDDDKEGDNDDGDDQ